MFPGKFSAVIVIIGLLLCGCGKNPRQAAQGQASTASKVATAVDTGDVFARYYRDSIPTAGQDTGNFRTFTMSEPEKKSGIVATGLASAAASPAALPVRASLPADRGDYVVQIASAKSGEEADSIAALFRKKGYSVYIIAVNNPGSRFEGTFYRVRVGGFTSRSEAMAFGENVVRAEKRGYWVDLKSNEASFASSSMSTPVRANSGNRGEKKSPYSTLKGSAGPASISPDTHVPTAEKTVPAKSQSPLPVASPVGSTSGLNSGKIGALPGKE